MDKITVERRSANMARIRSKDSVPELLVRQMLRTLGLGYRLHRKDLPGKPDIVLSKYKAIIFVHGCFWHQHPNKDCRDSRLPKSNETYWQAKLSKNVARDEAVHIELNEAGWKVLTIWECETKDRSVLLKKVQDFFSDAQSRTY